MENKDSLTVFDKALIWTIGLTIVLSIVLFFVTGNKNGEVKSLVIGEVLSLCLNLWHSRTILSIDKDRLKFFSIFSFIIRYTIMIIFVVVAAIFGGFSPIYLVVGLSLYAITLTILSIFGEKRYQNDSI